LEGAHVTQDELRALAQRCTDTRLRVLEQVEVAGGGHYGSSLSLVELVVSLFHRCLRVRPDDPEWAERDRFILSKGHGCSTLYAVLAELGFFDLDVLGTFTRLGSILGDHPDRRKVPGVDFSSGSLGHGLSVGVGMAQGLRAQGRHDSRVCVLIGDGEQDEGQIWEGAAAGSWNALGNLLVVCDRNNVQVDGTTEETMSMEPIADKWRAFGWNVLEVDGHDLTQLCDTWERLDADRASTGQPTFVLAHTVAGKGIPAIEGDAAWHVGYLHGPDVDAAVETIRAVHADLLEEVPS
jgi:transketolase